MLLVKMKNWYVLSTDDAQCGFLLGVKKRNKNKPFRGFKSMMMQDTERQSQECTGKGFHWITLKRDHL